MERKKSLKHDINYWPDQVTLFDILLLKTGHWVVVASHMMSLEKEKKGSGDF